MPRTIFVTTALPYANGSFHIGHIMEYIQADTWVRAMRMAGHTVHFVGADDAHGAPIMLKAQAEGITPQALVARYADERPKYLNGFHIRFDHWHCTDSPENIELSQDIYRALKNAGFIDSREIEQFYDPVKGMFLPDRYIKGECPRCHAKDQYGDSCESCGAVYSPTELIDPYSTLTQARPVLRSSEHFFFRLSDPRCVAFLQEWTTGRRRDGTPRLQAEVLGKTREWLGTAEGAEANLADWDISRDEPYFGIPIPDAPGKYFYVWLDAPVGYLASLKAYCRLQGLDYDALLAPDGDTEQVHFIGKDIVYFHALFWPAMLKFSGRKIPDMLHVHGFITVSGEKMSKSRGTGISPLRYLDIGMDAEWLRYYIAAKLNAHVEDLDFNPDDFVARVNSDLIGKYVNIASRAATFITRHFDGALAYTGDTDAMRAELRDCAGQVRADFEAREYGRAIRRIMAQADKI
ncbi:MAG TPA: methionine--tRNA ligase, partial [Castellaniella sp.]|nr:methionine--tRNA ligase [Castellaniella sp.]